MNDYSIGALEALSWAKQLLENCENEAQYRRAKVEVDRALLDLVTGGAVHFRDRLTMIPKL
jgi:hypothetical protein